MAQLWIKDWLKEGQPHRDENHHQGSGHTTLDIRQLPSFSASGHHLHLLCRTDIEDFLQDCRLLQEMRMVVWSLPVPLYISLYVAIITLALDSWSSTRRVTKGTTRAKICLDVTMWTIRFNHWYIYILFKPKNFKTPIRKSVEFSMIKSLIISRLREKDYWHLKQVNTDRTEN